MRLLMWVMITATVVGCNGPPKETGTEPPLTTDLDGDGFAADADCNDNDSDINPAAEEVCDDVDNNCDEIIDDTTTNGTSWYLDADGDGYGDPTAPEIACDIPSGYVANNSDCNDADATISPDAQEICDDANIDEDCNGLSNDGDPNATGGGYYYADRDGDTYGDMNSAALSACNQPFGYATEPVDCDDSDAAVHPGALEICDGADNDCDTLGDEDDPDVTGQSTWYVDGDGDGHGTVLATLDACSQPAGYAGNSDDCNDTNGAIYPGATEICDGQDNDCNSLSDEADPNLVGGQVWYLDSDGDGYGDATQTSPLSCNQPASYVADNSDCNDSNRAINPGAQEVCDSNDADEDCDGVADDNDLSVSGLLTWYIDNDGDGYGDNSTTLQVCDQPTGYVENDLDPLEDASFSTLSATADLSEVVDVASNATTLYAVGFNHLGEPVVVGVDTSLGTITELYAGDPLVQPSGLALSPDGQTLYISDVAATTVSDTMSGGVFEMPVSGAVLTELGVSDAIDLPGDVAISADGSTLYVSALNSAGTPGIYTLSANGGTPALFYSGSRLAEPLALTVSPDGASVYVIDGSSAAKRGALLEISGGQASVLAQDFHIAFPGGVTVSEDGAWLFYTTYGPEGVYALSADGGMTELLDTQGLLVIPTGISVAGGNLWISDASDENGDIFSISY